MVSNKDLPHEKRIQIMQDLFSSLKANGKPRHGVVNELATKHGVCRKSITRVWAKVKQQYETNTVINLQTKRIGITPASNITFDEEKFKSLEYTVKTTQHSIARAMNVSQSTVYRWKKNKCIRKHTNAIKPALTDKNKLDRLLFSLSKCHFDTQSSSFKFNKHSNVVHIDEKHFFLTKTSQTYYLSPHEMEPHRETQSKRFVSKVMFMCAVARPWYGSNGDLLFDGKICIFPFIVQERAQRSSKYRRRGEMVTKPLQSITKQHMRRMLIDNVLPAIRAKWPEGRSKVIQIQQDNAKPHITDIDEEWTIAANLGEFQFQLVQQPPNSPDMNVLDLGFFRSIQALQHKKAAYNCNALITTVSNAFDNLDPISLKYVWITLQDCMIEVMKRRGGIDYHIPHMNKTKLARLGLLPNYLKVQTVHVMESFQYLSTLVESEVLNQLFTTMECQSFITQQAITNYQSINQATTSQQASTNIEPTTSQQALTSNEPTTSQ